MQRNSPIIEFLLSKEIKPSDAISKVQWDLVDKIVAEYNPSEISDAVYTVYKKGDFSRHQVATLFSMIVWHSSDYDLAVGDFFTNKLKHLDSVDFGLLISRRLEWFPFGTPSETLKEILVYRKQYPQFNKDFEYWVEQSYKNLRK